MGGCFRAFVAGALALALLAPGVDMAQAQTAEGFFKGLFGEISREKKRTGPAARRTQADAGDERGLTAGQRRTIQQELNNRGFAVGNPDGVFGDGTRAGISRYQSSRGEPATGRLTAQQIADLTARRPSAPAAPSGAGFEVMAGYDLSGHDYRRIDGVAIQQCEAACAGDNACQAYTYNTEKSVCFLKSAASTPTRFAAAVSGRRTGAPAAQSAGRLEQGFVMYADTDLPGGDGSLISQKPGSMEACRLECLFNDRCEAFTYNHNVDVCLGKGSAFIGWANARPTPFKGATSGRKASPLEVAGAQMRYWNSGAKVEAADLAWRKEDTGESFVARIRAAARPMGGACEAERAEMERIAASVAARTGATAAVAGSSLTLEWSAAPQAKAPPIWLMVSVDGPARFTAPGFYALTPGAIAPFGLATDAGRTRALTTLFGKGALDGGTMEITPLRAGELALSVRAVGYLRACEEEFSREVAAAAVTVSPSPEPTFQVRDPFSFEQPEKIWLSPDGETRLEVFDGRFRVVDMASGAFIADREGRNPHYSPTGRFVVVSVGENSDEIIDAVDGKVVTETRPRFIGWENSDSFVVEGWGGGGVVMAHSLLVEGASVGNGTACRICPGREEPYLLDLENDVFHGPITQRLSGKRGVSNIPGDLAASANRFVAEQTGVAPLHHPKRWHFRGGLRFARAGGQLYGSADGATLNEAELDERLREDREHVFLAKELKLGEVAGHAGLQPVGIGNWRGAVAMARPATRETSIMDRLTDIGLELPAGRKPFIAKSSAPDEAIDAEIAEQIASDVPQAGRAFVAPDFGCYPDGVYKAFNHAQRYELANRILWLTQYECVEGSAVFYATTGLHLFDSALREGYTQIQLEHPTDTTANVCTIALGACNVASRLFDDRYLVIWSTESRALAVYDIETQKIIWSEFSLGRGDLLKEAFYAPDTGHVVQINSDSSFYVYDVRDGQRVLEGRYVDDETIAWTPDLQFDASPEGANYVNLRFPGQRGQYSFQQFAAKVKKPGLVAEVLGRTHRPVGRALDLPPRLTGELSEAGGRIVGKVSASGGAELRVYQDGLLTDTIAIGAPGGDIAFDVQRIGGARWVSLVAYDEDGLASLPVGRDLAAADGAMPTVHALTVGVDDYAGAGLQALRYAKADATTLLDALEAQDGRSVALGISATLSDADATPERILERASEMAAAARKGETIVFSFAGHGVTGPNGEFYLATTRTDVADIPGTALAWRRLVTALSATEARVVVFLDACHSGAAGTALFATNDDAVEEALQTIPSGLLVFSASKGRQFSEESSAIGGGLFTNAVADVIARNRGAHDLDGNGAIEISELYAGVKRRVSELSAGRQVPWLARNELVGDFALF